MTIKLLQKYKGHRVGEVIKVKKKVGSKLVDKKIALQVKELTDWTTK